MRTGSGPASFHMSAKVLRLSVLAAASTFSLIPSTNGIFSINFVRPIFLKGFSNTAPRKTYSTKMNLAGTVREILKMGDSRLLRVAQQVEEFDTKELHLLVADMHATMRSANGAGLAAPQIGVDKQVVVFGSNSINPRYPDRPIIPPTVLINPTITPLSVEVENGWEGCLSVPGMRGEVPRWSHVRYTGFDQFGTAINREVDGFHARVVQHECDHLWGKLYPMRMTDLSKFGFTEVLFPELVAVEDD
jgi:peptide deformylase